MKCIYCGSTLTESGFCPACGADVTLQKRIGKVSDLLYNRGLEKASVRDLSGAIGCLRQSLKFNKENIDARNLLGLCYYETGQAVAALSEWVISKNLKSQDNSAEYYLNRLQNDRNLLDDINQSIRKYNQSLDYCLQNNEDMAVMQLKKVVAKNPKLVCAQQLLSLIYMKREEYEKARKLLKKAAAIDNTDTTTLRYLSEIESATGRSSFMARRRQRLLEEEEEDEIGSTLRYVSGTETVIQPTTFRDSSAIATFINIGLGILLGGAVIWFMAVPAARQSAQDAANQQVTDANLKLATQNAQFQDLQDQIDDYEQQVEDANEERDEALAKADSYSDLMAAANTYLTGKQSDAADAVSALNADDLDGNAKKLYDALVSGVSSTQFSAYYQAGTTAYVAGDYETAAQQLQLAVDVDPNGAQEDYYNALYYLGFAYYNQGDTENADKVFEDLIEKYPDQASTIQPYLSSNDTSVEDLYASQGEASLSSDDQDGSVQDVTIYDDSSQSSTQTYDSSDVAWTDPTTGLNYDAYGNLLG